MKTLKHIDVFQKELESFGTKDYPIYSRERKERFHKGGEEGGLPTLNVDDLGIQDRLDKARGSMKQDMFSRLADFINEN